MTTTIPTIPNIEDEMLDLENSHDDVPVSEETLPSKPELTRILRWCGGGALVAASVVFMYQGVSTFSPMMRHWILLGISCLLGILGLFTGTALKDDKGARTFLGFAAASFPVLASQLGAMFFSIFGHAPEGMPQPLVFTLGNSSLVFTVTALTLAIVVPVSYLSFRILARSQAPLLTTLFTLANMCILVPLREGIWVGTLVTLMALTLFFYDNLRLRRDFRLESFEGRAARLILTTPLLIMIGRSFFYTMGTVYYGYMLILLGLFLAFHLGRIIEKTPFKIVSQVMGQLAMGIGWFLCLIPLVDGHTITPMMVYLFLLPLAGLVAAQSSISSLESARLYQKGAAIIAMISVVLSHGLDATTITSVLGILVALAIALAGTLTARKSILTLGALTGVIPLGNLCYQVIMGHSNYVWLALTLLGIGVLFTASLLESKRSWLNLKSTPLWGRLDSRG